MNAGVAMVLDAPGDSWLPVQYSLFAAGAIIGLVAGTVAVHRRGLEVRAHLLACGLGLVGAALLGHMVHVVATQPDPLGDIGALFDLTGGGFSSIGVQIGGAAGYLAAHRLAGKRVGAFADALVFPALGAGALARAGCLGVGCDFGTVAENAPLTVRYGPSLARIHHERIGAIAPDATMSAATHPLPVYELVGFAAVGGLAWLLSRSQASPPGRVAAGTAIAFFAMRFLVEQMRGGPTIGLAGLSVLQITSLLAVTTASAFWFRIQNQSVSESAGVS